MQPALTSYLGYPRIHFAGQFRADPDTRNNFRCNYRLSEPLASDLNADWGFNGTSEFQFYNTYVTAVVNKTGQLSTKDAIVGNYIIGNLRRPFAKLTDLDVDAQMHTTIYGMKFGIKWNNDFPDNSDDIAFDSNWTRAVIAQNIWPRLKCYNETHHGEELYQDTFPFGAQSTTVLTGINWLNLQNSSVLTQLREASNGGNLTVRITLQYYTRNYPPYIAQNATLGYVFGVIGVPSPNDTLNVPGERAMFNTNNTPAGLTFDNDDLCFLQRPTEFHPWMYTAPFEVDSARNEVRLDLSNSIPSDLSNSLRDIGTLHLGIYRQSENCVLLLGDESGILYLSDNDYPITSGIYSIKVDSSQMDKVRTSPLVIVQLIDGEQGDEICGERTFSVKSGHSALTLLIEYEYYIRPVGYYVERLDRSESPFAGQTLFVTSYGVPVQGIDVKVELFINVIPARGVVPSQEVMTTDNNGLATFRFQVQDTIPIPREYDSTQCNATRFLPIDGQVYKFSYCLAQESVRCTKLQYDINNIAILAFSDVSYSDMPTWVNDVSPILSQYAQLAPIMKTILDMSSYTDVTKQQNINLLNLTLRLGLDDPSYMPVTRDLSPTKKDMILRWLKSPIYDSSNSTVTETAICFPPQVRLAQTSSAEYFLPPRCASQRLGFQERPQERDLYFNNIYSPFLDVSTTIQGRPLFGRNSDNCTRMNVASQLQTAVQLEWATIPTYLTSLYSIVDGCNQEIYNLIRSVIIQEMLHMTQSANLLIAMNESPLIDSASVTPTFPTTLPGGVLPGLRVQLRKLSLQQVYDIFMAIEVPEKTLVVTPPIVNSNFTIGAFYGEISSCIEQLFDGGEEIFDASTLPRQVNWPWEPTAAVGTVIPITNSTDAVRAINAIIAQGEGAGLLDPNEIGSDTLSHFFKFEEIVCQKQLERIDDDNYAYSGPPIPFQSNGVWLMRDNPTTNNIPPDTNCYTESRVFHTAYRKLLKKLQEVFDGNPDQISITVELMESLQVHAKKLMWTKFNPDSLFDDTTCGPVWEYNWPLLEPNISNLVLLPGSASCNCASLILLLPMWLFIVMLY